MHRSWLKVGELLFVAMATEALFSPFDRSPGVGHPMLNGASERMRLSREKAKRDQTDVPSDVPQWPNLLKTSDGISQQKIARMRVKS